MKVIINQQPVDRRYLFALNCLNYQISLKNTELSIGVTL